MAKASFFLITSITRDYNNGVVTVLLLLLYLLLSLLLLLLLFLIYIITISKNVKLFKWSYHNNFDLKFQTRPSKASSVILSLLLTYIRV